MKFNVSVAVDGRLDVEVEADSFEDAKTKACLRVEDLDFNTMECIDLKAVNAEDENGTQLDY